MKVCHVLAFQVFFTGYYYVLFHYIQNRISSFSFCFCFAEGEEINFFGGGGWIFFKENLLIGEEQ